MLPPFYRLCLDYLLTPSQVTTLEILVWLLQFHKPVKIEQLAARFPLPIKYESRRKKIQIFLLIPYFTVNAIWIPIAKGMVKIYAKPKERIIVAIDRTQWFEGNLFIASWIKDKRAIPIFWGLLDQRGSSNLREQKKY